MTFLILAVLVFLIVLVVRTYKSFKSAAIGIILVLGTTTTVLAAGMVAMRGQDTLLFFNTSLRRSDFFYLLAAWYIADILCAMLIIRNFIAYKKVNAVTKK